MKTMAHRARVMVILATGNNGATPDLDTPAETVHDESKRYHAVAGSCELIVAGWKP